MSGVSPEATNQSVVPGVPEKIGRERRMHPRFDCEAQVQVRLVTSGITLSGIIRDLSQSGCKVQFEQPFPVGIHARLEVLFTLHGLPLMLPAVSRCIHTPRLVGIEFLQISDRKRQNIVEVIAELKEKIERENKKAAQADA